MTSSLDVFKKHYLNEVNFECKTTMLEKERMSKFYELFEEIKKEMIECETETQLKEYLQKFNKICAEKYRK
jgi:hypothetical protein